MAGSLSKAIGRGLSAGGDVLLMKWQADMKKAENERMREFKSKEGAKDRAVDQQRVDQQDKQLDMESEKLELYKEEKEKAISVLNNQIKSTSMELEDKKKARELIGKLRELGPDQYEERANIFNELSLYGIEPPTGDYKFMKLTEKNQYGAPIGEKLVRTNERGEAEVVEPTPARGSAAGDPNPTETPEANDGGGLLGFFGFGSARSSPKAPGRDAAGHRGRPPPVMTYEQVVDDLVSKFPDKPAGEIKRKADEIWNKHYGE